MLLRSSYQLKKLEFLFVIVLYIDFFYKLKSTTYAISIATNDDLRCLNCIRNVSSLLAGPEANKRCEGYYCGPFQISYTYWAEAGKPGNNQGAKDFEKCARDRQCAEQTVRAYFRKFKRDCNNDGQIDCLDMAALHKAGPSSCSSDWFYKSKYWLAFSNKTDCSSSPLSTVQATNENSLESFDLNNIQQNNKQLKNQSLTNDCLDCICDAVSGCNTSVNNCGSGAVCGPFAISLAYWKDSRKPGSSWTACARTKECSSVTIRNYMEKYKKDCNNDGVITCEDYAAIHRRGPRACSNKDLFKDHYWNKFLACRANQLPSKDVNMVKVNENSPTDNLQMSNQAPVTSKITDLFTTTTPNQFTTQSPPPITATTITSLNTPTINTLPPTSLASITMQEINSQDNIQIKQLHPRPPLPIDYEMPLIVVKAPQISFTTSTVQPHIDQPAPSMPISTIGNLQNTMLVMKQQQQPDSSHHSVDQETNPSAPIQLSTTPQKSPSNNEQETNDYPMQEYSSINTPNQSTDKFDRTVIDIVGNPDFAKSYPPIPILQQQDNKLPQQNVELQTTDEKRESIVVKTPLQTLNTNHSKGNTNQSTTSKHITNSQNKQNNSIHQKNTISHQQQQQQQQQNLIDRKETINSIPQTAPETSVADNMSTFLDKNLNESYSRIASECLECICDASSNCDTSVQCISKQRDKNRCGLYMISWNQYQESDISLVSGLQHSPNLSQEMTDEKLYYECTTDRACAEKLIHLYIEKHQRDCNNDGKIDCFDIAAIHRVGPDQCNSDKFLSSHYWKDFNNCYDTDKLTTTITPLPPTPSTRMLYT